MSGVFNSSIVSDNTGRSFSSPFSAQPGSGAPMFHQTGIQGLHNMHSNYNVPSMIGSLPSRSSTMNGVPSSGMQQSSGNLLTGRFVSNNLSDPLSQISHHGISHGHSSISNRGMSIVGNPGYSNSTNIVGGSIPGVLPTSSAGAGNRGGVQGLGVSPMLGNTGLMGNIVGSNNINRNMSSVGGLSVPGLASRMNFSSSNSGLQGPNGLMGGVHQQASSQAFSMLGDSYISGGSMVSHSQAQAQAVNNLSSRGMLHEMNSSDPSPFAIDDFPALGSQVSGAPLGQIGSMRKQGLVGQIGQRNQEFRIQNEDFPALPGFKGGSVDFGKDFHQKDQLQDNNASMMQSQQFPMGRSTGFTVGGTYSSHQPQPQHQQQHMPTVSGSNDSFTNVNNQRLIQQSHGLDMFPSSISAFHIQGNRTTDNNPRTVNNSNSISSAKSYDQQMQQYQQQTQSHSHPHQTPAKMNQSFKDHQEVKFVQTPPDSFGLLGLLGVIRTTDPDLTSLALGIDLSTLGLDLNASEELHKSFASPWTDEMPKGEPEFVVPKCYLEDLNLHLNYRSFEKLQTIVLFYIFYSMPKDELQLYAAHELHRRGWLYHKELRVWLARIPNVEPLVKTPTYEKGSYKFFNPTTFQEMQKDDFVLKFEMIERKPAFNQH